MNDFYFIFYLFVFSNLWCSSKSSTKFFNHVLDIDHVYGGKILLKYFYILAISPRTHCRIFKFENLWKLTTQKNSITSILILMFSKKERIRFNYK